MIIATAGHVDHGKTALIKALTGTDTDRLPEEKKRGLTIDLGFAYQTLDNGARVGFIDVPGHEKFVRNMVAGVGGIDFALIIIAADDGPMPQTREHLAILGFMGLTRGAIALNKIDRVSPERLVEVQGEIKALLSDTVLAAAPVFPLSAITGEGVPDLQDCLHQAAADTSTRDTSGNFRLSIDRAFSIKGAGLVITGTAVSGQVKIGDQLLVSPSGKPVRVRGLHVQDQQSEVGQAGQRCAVNIAGDVDKEALHRGDWLLAPAAHAPVKRLDARLQVAASEAKALKHWSPVHLHLGAGDFTARVAVLEGGTIAPGDAALVQLVTDAPIAALKGDRFVLRDQSAKRTIAGGVIIDPFSPTRGRARPSRIAAVTAMENADPATALAALLKVQPGGTDLGAFAIAHNLSALAGENLFAQSGLIQVQDGKRLWGLSTDRWNTVCVDALAAMATWHNTHPHVLGASARELISTIPDHPAEALIKAALHHHRQADALVCRGPLFHLPGHSAQPQPEDLALWEKTEPLLREGGLRPLRVRELTDALQIKLIQTEKFLTRAAATGWVFRVARNRYFLPETLMELANLARELADASDENKIDIIAFRDRTGIGRNLAIEVLEFFDSVGLTKRDGNTRTLIAEAKNIFGS
ncbi:MAG: selenocysteine-specific translation elongation factor [Alphaproteobacteria bacterium]|nr:selenocysteine-specific translation elongation factor [Alphaproteobacteria bacterium]